MGLFEGILSPRVKQVTKWLGRLDSNQRMAVPKTAALPLGDAPLSLQKSQTIAKDRLSKA